MEASFIIGMTDRRIGRPGLPELLVPPGIVVGGSHFDGAGIVVWGFQIERARFALMHEQIAQPRFCFEDRCRG